MTTGSTDIGLPSPRSPLRGRLVLAAVLLVLGTAGAIGAVFLWSALSTVESLSSALIDSTTKRTRGELDDFVRTVRDDVSVLRGLAGAMPTPLARGADLASQWVPFMRTRKQITAIRLADSSGREYELLRVGDRWFGRTTLWTAKPDEQQTTEWSEWTDASGPEGALQYEKELNYDPRTRPWFQEAMARDPDTISWTSPYIFFTTKQPGITASTRWRHGDRNVCVSVDVTLSDISRFTTGLDISPRGTAVVLADSGRVIGLPRNARYSDPANVSRDILRPIEELEQPSITDAFARWKEEAHTTGAFSYESNDETWWAGFQDLAISDSRKLLIGVVVPEADFRTNIDGPRDFAIAIAGIAFVIALLVGRRLSRAVDAEIEDAADRARRLGQYTLEGRIGEGGMGAVYRARHAMLRRPTAIKLLHADQAGSALALQRFESEVQQTARLTHPNTIRIYDYGRTPEDVFYYAMELLEGVTLEDVVTATGPMEPARVIHILRQVCGSLQEAHAAGLVHRDVKPANVMLCRQGGAPDFVKVLDFGLVKSLESEAHESATEHDVAGSPRYIAPESLTDPNAVDGRADLYAVGAVGYFLLTGTPVFEGESIGELITGHLQTVPTRPSLRTGRALPTDLEDVLLACLEKSAADRPQTAAELATRLDACKDAVGWSDAQAEEWWANNATSLSAVWSGTVMSGATPGPLTIDLRARVIDDTSGTHEERHDVNDAEPSDHRPS